jgi:molecular chaperone GrpE
MRNRHHDKPGHPGEPNAGGVQPEGQPAATETGAATGTEPLSVEELQRRLAEKEKEVAELKDKYLRALADSENARKRIRQQADESIRVQRENLLRELLPIVDNLERAVDAARGGGNGKPIVEGVEMTLRSMLDFLKAQGVQPLSAVGQPFDPSRHEAVDQVQSERHTPNTVVDEFHRGYLIGDRVLRPARVSVAREEPGGQRSSGEDPDSGVENQ